jgi:hypothetical protein
VRDRGAKDPHDAVADVLVDISAVLQDDAVGATEELLDQCMQLFGVELLAPGRVTGEIRKQNRYLPPLADRIGLWRRCWRLFSQLLGGPRVRTAQRGDGIKQLAAVTDQANAEFLEVFSGQLRQNLGLYGIVAKCLLVLAQIQAAQPCQEVHAGFLIRSGYNSSTTNAARWPARAL